MHDRLVHSYDKAYGTYRALHKRKPRRQPWEADLRVPYAMQIIDTTMVNIIGGKPRAVVKPRRPGDDKAAKSMQIAQDYYVARDHLAEKQVPFTQQALIYGGTGAKNQWAYREDSRQRRQFVPNPFDPYQPHAVVGHEKVILKDGPTFEPWDIYDMWWEPNARDVQSAGYFVLRSWLTKDECLAMERTEDNPFGLLDNVQDLLQTGSRSIPTQTAQESYLGKQQEKRKDRFEILEVWTNDTLTVIGNDAVLLRAMPNPFWHGQKPIVFVSCRPDIFEMQGIPETDLVADIQEALWTVQNMRVDNMHATVQRGITYRESGVTDPNALVMKPRFKWAVQDHDDVRPFEVQPLPPEAWREDEKMLSQMQLVSGVNPYVSGADLGSVDQNTATGVTALQEVASRLLRFKARQLAYAGYQRTFEQWVGLTKQFLTEKMAIRIDGPGDQYTWHDLDPQDVVGDYDVSVEGTEESLSRQQARGEIMGLLNAFAPLAQLGIINWEPILAKVAEVFDFSSAEQLIKQPEQAPPAAPAPGAAPGMPPGMPLGNGNGAQAGGPGGQPMQMPQLDPRIRQAALQTGGMRLG